MPFTAYFNGENKPDCLNRMNFRTRANILPKTKLALWTAERTSTIGPTGNHLNVSLFMSILYHRVKA